MNRYRPLLVPLIIPLWACEGTPHGPIEGAGRGLEQKDPSNTLESTLKGLKEIPDPIAENEDNNTANRAMLIAPGQRIKGTFESSSDVDWFRIEVPEPSVLRAEVAKVEHADARMSLYGKEGKRLLRSVNNTGKDGPEVISNFQVAGTHFLKVESLGKKRRKATEVEESLTPSYTLVMVKNPKSLEDEEEPNGAQRKASTLPIGGVVRGYLNVPEDVDYFKAPPAPPGTSGWSLGFSSPPNCPSKVEVYRGKSSRATITEVAAGRRTEIFGINAVSDETLFVKVSGMGSVNTNTPYRLSLVPLFHETENQHPPFSEPNDSTRDSLEMVDSSRDWIGWAGDRDFWRVSNARHGILKIDISGVPGVPLCASVVDAEGNASGIVEGEPGEGLLLPNVRAGSTPQFVVVEARKNAFNTVTPYTLKTTYRKGVGEEREPNNNLSEALRQPGFSMTSSTEGYLGWPGDTDWHHLDLRQEPMANIMTFKVQAPPSVTIQVTWTDSSGTPLVPVEVIPANTLRTLTTFAPPASYGIEIRGVAGGHSTNEPYSLTVVR